MDDMLTAAVEARKEYTLTHLREWWDLLFTRVTEEKDGFGMFGASTYVLHVGDARLLVDPAVRPNDNYEVLADCMIPYLEKLDGVVLTHMHADHYDKTFIRHAAEAKIKWYVPDFFPIEDLVACGLTPESVVTTSPGMTVTLGNTELSFFESNHRNEGMETFVMEYGFCLCHAGKQYVFPCDVRTYDPSFYGSFPNTEVLFSHVWLGRGKAMETSWEPKMQQFCEFVLSFGPKRVTLGHLYETGRPLTELWRYQHAGAVMDRLLAMDPALDVTILKPGVWFTL